MYQLSKVPIFLGCFQSDFGTSTKFPDSTSGLSRIVVVVEVEVEVEGLVILEEDEGEMLDTTVGGEDGGVKSALVRW